MNRSFTYRASYGLAFLLIPLFAFVGSPANQVRYTFDQESKLWMEGTSTLHDYTCEATKMNGFFEGAATGDINITRVELNVPVANIECKNNTMNRLMRNALKASANPNIRYELQSARVISGDAAKDFKLQATGRLTIAGKTQPVQMTVQGQRQQNGTVRFQGQHQLLMSDFDVERPTAMLGTIRTDDRVTVHFDVVASAATPSVSAR